MRRDYWATGGRWPPYICPVHNDNRTYMSLSRGVTSATRGVFVPSHASSSDSGRAASLAPSSWPILLDAQRGDVRALAALIERYLPQLRRWAHGRLPRWARTVADTADLVHDALVR